uniref:Enzymatic polyprotein n=1 Tax=Tanacetum cinerariifolium TaxID=118510 RepID=A0A699KRY2_TANCI|nr:enzymatic polyprotein [Tanacetum cinerariifolium]
MEAIIKQVQLQLQQKQEQKASLKEQISIVEKEETELQDVLQNLTQNVRTRPESSTQKSTQASNLNTQQPSSPSPGRQAFMKREKEIEKVLQNSSHEKPKWYVIFNGPFRGIYTDWATASTHIIGKSISHKSYLTKEAAEKALEESYKTIATEETQKSKQFVSLNQHLQSQTAKLNAFNRMKNIPTAKEKEEMRRPTVEKFQRLLDSLMNYNEVHATMLFYPKKRRNIGPKAVFMPEASPKDIYDYYVHGLVDTIYINGETLKELQEFPVKVQGIIRGYKEVFARGRELFLKLRSSYPIFDKEQKLLVSSITVAQLGVSNKGYPDKDEKIVCAPPTIKDLVYSFIEVLTGS